MSVMGKGGEVVSTRRMHMAVSVDLSKGLDKAYEDKSLDEILKAPPSALSGLTEKHDELLQQLGIKTVADLGANKYFALAGVLVALSNKLSRFVDDGPGL
jgi:hypothetical protein